MKGNDMKKIFVLVIVILEIVTLCFPFGNVVLAENGCPDGNGWNSPTFPPGAEVRTGGNPFSIKSANVPIVKICLNGQIYEQDGTIGDFSVVGLGTMEVWIYTSGDILITSQGTYKAFPPTTTPTTTPEPIDTATPTNTITSETPTTTLVPSNTATTPTEQPISISSEKKKIVIGVISLLAIALAVIAIIRRKH